MQPWPAQIYPEGQAARPALTKSVIRSEIEEEQGVKRIYLNRGFKVLLIKGALKPSS